MLVYRRRYHERHALHAVLLDELVLEILVQVHAVEVISNSFLDRKPTFHVRFA